MGMVRVLTGGRAGELIDELRAQDAAVSRAQARRAELMVEFADTRKACDHRDIADRRARGEDPRFKAGEFAGLEISLAVKTSKFAAQRIVAMTRRVQAECPDAWDAWVAGDIDQERVLRINRALRRLVHDSSKQLLNSLVVEVAVGQTPELLGRWLNQFIARLEPEEQDERLRRSMDDRYASVRPDVDGMSFLSCMMSAVDAAAIDRILSSLAAAASPGDLRTMRQRRSDALVDMLCGRISNGCHVVWDANDDRDDHLDNTDTDDTQKSHDPTMTADSSPTHDPTATGDSSPTDVTLGKRPADTPSIGSAPSNASPKISVPKPVDDQPNATPQPGDGTPSEREDRRHDLDRHPIGRHPDDVNGDDQFLDDSAPGDELPDDGEFSETDWDAGDWELPAAAFRADPPWSGSADPPEHPWSLSQGRTGNGTWRVTPCAGGHEVRPAPVVIGVVVSIQSLAGATNSPGQLMDRSAMVPAGTIRDMAQQPGTLFYRLLTDELGNLLDVTEMGRFPSRKLGMAVRFRDGTCSGPTCTKPASDCDLDHLVPVPSGPTTASNLNDKCRHDHRAKTHAGHMSARTGEHASSWTTPTGHRYITADPPLPVEAWPPHDQHRAMSADISPLPQQTWPDQELGSRANEPMAISPAGT